MIRKLLIAPIRFYQKYLSGTKRYSHCKYYPTCSQKYGPLKGLGLAAWRILRCNPFSKGGYDPVP